MVKPFKLLYSLNIMNICNIDYDNELNTRINPRNYASQDLKPIFDVRPISTKYTVFQTIDERPIVNTPLFKYKPYTSEVFNPGSRGQVDFYMKEIDTESKLRHQFMALQKSSQSIYVPELNSSLYEYNSAYKKESYAPTECTTKPPCFNLAPNPFYNTTRMNIRN